jgi:hypothetical protein
VTCTSLQTLETFISKTLEEPIRLLLREEFYPAALVLTFSAMDTMAYLAMPAGKQDVMRSDFIDWAEKYMIFEGSSQRPTAQDLYGARCGILHGQGTSCRRTREGKCQPIRFVFRVATSLDIRAESDRKVDPNLAFLKLDVEEFAKAFINGARWFLSSLGQDSKALNLACSRLREITDSIPSVQHT